MNKLLFGLMCGLLFFAGCKTGVRVEKPEGFAEYREGNMYHAISPEGVKYRVRIVKNYPEMEIGFWQETLKKQMLDEGYTLLDEDETPFSGSPGFLFEWGAPVGHENFVYITAATVVKDKIIIAEAAGKVGKIKDYRQAIRDSIASIEL